MITQALIEELFFYNNQDGFLYWKKAPSNLSRIKLNEKAGRLHHKGYIDISILGKRYLAHRLIYIMHYGDDNIECIDHINGIRNDNRIHNLKSVSKKNNQKNVGLSAKNTSGQSGVYFDKTKKIWRANGQLDGKKIYIGKFKLKEDAVRARIQWQNENGFSSRHGK